MAPAVVVNFRPDLIIVSVDPHEYSDEANKPEIVGWMKANPDYFEEIYRDETVSGFRVRECCRSFEDMIPIGYKLNMSG